MSTHASLLPARTPRSAFGKLLQSEIKVAWRVPIGLILGVAVPILVLIIFGTIPGMNKPAASLGGLTYFAVHFPILIAVVLAVLSLISLPVHLATYREQGILRRMSTTPVPPSWMLAAQVIINLALAVVALGILVVAGTAGFGLGTPKAPGGFTLALILTIAAMFAIGLWVSAIARTAGWAGGIGQLFLYPLLFFSGMSIVQERMTPMLRQISQWSPLGASVLKIRRAPLVTAKVNVKWYEDGTTLQAAPGEVWILQGINALTIYPKVRHTISQAFASAVGRLTDDDPVGDDDDYQAG